LDTGGRVSAQGPSERAPNRRTSDRRQRDGTLREREERYRALFDSSDCVYLLDFEGRFLDANLATLELLGYEHNEMLALSFSSLLDDDQRAEASAVLAELMQTGSQKTLTDFRLRRKTGEYVDVETRASVVLRRGEPHAVLGIGRDVTEHDQAEEALARQNDLLSKISRFAVELSLLPSEENLQAFIARKLKEISGAEVAIFSEYDPVERTTTVKHVETESGLLDRLVGLLGRQLDKMQAFVSDEMYHEMTTDLVGVKRTLHEASFGAISRPVGSAVQAFLKVDRFIGIAYLIEGNLYGTSLLAMGRGKPDPPKTVLESFSSLAAVSLQRKQAEKALCESQELFSLLMRYSPVYTYIKEVTPTESRVVQASHNFHEMIGVPGENMLGKTMEELFPADLAAKMTADDWAVVSEGKMRGFEEDLDGRNYTTIKFPLVWGDKKLLAGFTIDVTDRKQAEEKLRESERLLTEAQRLGKIGSWEWTPAEDKVIWSAEMYVIFGIAPEAGGLTTEMTMRAFPSEDRAMVAEVMRRTLEGRETQPIECRIIRPDGTAAYVYGRGEAVRDARGGLVKMTGIFQDITERKQAEEALRLVEEQLHQSQKMEAVGQLAGGIAHDFNNLLTAILGYSDLILSSESSTVGEVRPDMEEIRRAGERASALTQQILAFSRRQTLRPQVVLLDKVLRGIEPLLRRTIGEDIDLEIIESTGLAPVEVDPHHFEQVVMNLVLNARDAMPSGGRLTVETANVELDEEFSKTHAATLPGSYVLFRVSDTGMGMDEATQDRIFEPFFTTKAAGAGTGLGLATVYGIIKQSNGSLFVTSAPGMGSSIAIYLPRATQPQVPAEALIPLHVSAPGHETVMVVEDEEALRGLILRIMGAAGYKTLIFSSAQEALAALEKGEAGVDLLLTDVMLPGPIQGHDLAQIIRTSRPQLPVLYMSGYARDALVHAGRLDEGVNLIEKPFTPRSLTDMVREVLDMPRASG
jgi:PAS domain S-box-containing protein